MKKVLTMPLTGAIITFADAARKEMQRRRVPETFYNGGGGGGTSSFGRANEP